MKSHTGKTASDDTPSHVEALITAQDAAYIEPLREFLHESGCSVYVNKELRDTVMYWFVAGDAEYVKSFADRMPLQAQRRLCIVYEGDVDEREYIRAGIKVALVDPIALTRESVKKLFAFLITGKTQISHDRKGHGAVRKVSVIPKQSAREPRTEIVDMHIEDSSRISLLMKQLFVPTHASGGQRRRRSGISQRRKYLLWISILATLVFIPIASYMISCLLSVTLLYGSSKALLTGNTVWADRYLGASRRYIRTSQSLLGTGAPVLDRIGLGVMAQDQESVLDLLGDIAQSEAGVIAIISTSKEIVTGMLGPAIGTAKPRGVADILILRSEVIRVSQLLALVQTQLDTLLTTGRFPFSHPAVQSFGHRGLDAVVRLRNSIEMTRRLLTLYPEVTGYKKPQTYLVLLQNSMELRPTGGFIGSILLVTFTDGVLSDVQVQDVYAADGQLKGHVDPPDAIRYILGQEHWYLRDSNWNPDFSLSASQAAWFYEKEMGVSVDGVLAISMPMVTRLLEVTGPLELPDFNERISSKNFFVKSLLYTQADFFPGSTQKKDFLGSLTNALLMHLTTDKDITVEKLLAVVSASLDSRDLQFYFTDAEVQSVVTRWDWAGAVGFVPCQPVYRDAPCVTDGVGMVAANLGVNKANYFIQQEAQSRVRLYETGELGQELIVSFHNASTSQTHDGGGTYQAYVRFVYPPDTELLSVAIDGQVLPIAVSEDTPASISSSVVIERSAAVTSVGVPVFVPPKSDHQLAISTRRAGPFLFAPFGTYEFVIRKQAGVESIPWSVSFEYPELWRATSDVDLAKPGWLQYNTNLTRDAKVTVLFDTSL